jgi:hypothetical protein
MERKSRSAGIFLDRSIPMNGLIRRAKARTDKTAGSSKTLNASVD